MSIPVALEPVTATAGALSVALSWPVSVAPDIESVLVLRKIDSFPVVTPAVQIADLQDVSATSFTDVGAVGGIVAGTVYTYFIAEQHDPSGHAVPDATPTPDFFDAEATPFGAFASISDAMLYAAPGDLESILGDGIPLGHRSSPGNNAGELRTRLEMAAIRVASATVRDALCTGGYTSLAAGRELAGTVTATNGSAEVTGIGTTFDEDLTGQDAVHVGSVLVLGDVSYTVRVVDPLVLNLTDPHVGVFSGTARTVAGDAATSAAITRATAIEMARNLEIGTSGRPVGLEAALEAHDAWVEMVRAGAACFTDFGGGTIGKPPLVSLDDLSPVTGQRLDHQAFRCFSAAGV